MNRSAAFSVLLVALTGAGCAGGPPPLPYPAYVQVDELEDVFMASLPGVRAKPLVGDARTRRGSYRIDIPPDWSGTSGASPGRSVELFVLRGAIRLADIELGPGGYAFLPSGSLGFNLRSAVGARVLYFLSDVDPQAVIRTPIIIDTALIAWESTDAEGIEIKVLRQDPGSGAKSWLERVTPAAEVAWQSTTTAREGYLVEGQYRGNECRLGRSHPGLYLPGSYFFRPPDTVHGGSEARADIESVWLLRELSAGTTSAVAGCENAAGVGR